jgi:hypothetical protein
MKTSLFTAILCLLLLSAGCLENGSQKSNAKSNDNTTTTTTTDTDKGSNSDGKTDNKTDDNKKKNEKKNSFQSANGKFSINFPAPPAGPESRVEQNKAGLMQLFTYSLALSDNAGYFVYYKDYHSGVITDSNTEDMLKKEADAFMKNCGTKVSKSASERLDGNKGLSFSGTLNDTIAINMRAFFVGRRYYQFGTIAANGEISDTDSKKFINSFEIIK